MKVKVLGCSGAEYPGFYPTAFLLDGGLMLDGGTISARLTEREQWRVRNILITHSHLDHIKAIPFLADNIVIKNRAHSVTLYGIRETLAALRKNLLNDELWPDFTKISAAIEPVLRLKQVAAGRPFQIDGYKVSAWRVHHTVPAVGYIVRDAAGRVLLYTGDTGPTEAIWKASDRVDMAIVEVSFPNRMEELALRTGHLTARLLRAELEKAAAFPGRVMVTHPKPQYLKQIRTEILGLKDRRITMIKDGKTYEV
jgi:ribonuclease BN (tRNA processing enzyme)